MTRGLFRTNYTNSQKTIACALRSKRCQADSSDLPRFSASSGFRSAKSSHTKHMSTGIVRVCRKAVLLGPSLSKKLSLYSACTKRLQHTEPVTQDLQLTNSAIKRLRELGAQGLAAQLRLTVEAGGCSGFSYKFKIDDSIKPDDELFESDGVKLVTDNLSLEFFRGSKVDYSEELIKSAFEVIDNPNADKGCGCGASFTPK